MAQTTDLPFDMVGVTVRNMTRTGEILLDTQSQFLRFRLKAAETALADIHDMQDQLESAHDWPALAVMPGALLRAQATYLPSLLKAWVDLINNSQAIWLRHARECSEPLQRQ